MGAFSEVRTVVESLPINYTQVDQVFEVLDNIFGLVFAQFSGLILNSRVGHRCALQYQTSLVLITLPNHDLRVIQ